MKSRSIRPAAGFTLVEVLVALMIVAMGLAALMIAVSGTARTSGYLRDKTLAQWIALNRLSEVRLNVSKFGQNTDTGVLDYASRTWHYDTRYFTTSIPSMKRVVVRVWAGEAKAQGNPLAESIGFVGTSLAAPGGSNVDWGLGSAPLVPPAGTGQTGATSATPATTTTTTTPTTTTTTP
ncbi:MAG: type II secretion system minor pseudopilin GspI [Pseudomonadota bacterium]|nr:type II secretion system minor pseudopilin GspI [Pseudomonadota bacterium]